MAKMETVVKQIKPSLVNELIQSEARFGWEVLSTQEVVSTHDESRSDGNYSVTEKYTKITFQRDKERENYVEIAGLEAEFLKLESENPTPVYPKKYHAYGMVVLGVIGVIFGIFIAVSQRSMIGAVISTIGVLIMLGGIVSTKKRAREFVAAVESYNQRKISYEQAEARAEEILNRLKEIV